MTFSYSKLLAETKPLKSPVFLVGAERSGTTMFRLMLAHHPEIGVCPEFENALDPLVSKSVWPTTRCYIEQISQNWILRDQGFSIDRSLAVPQLIDSFLLQTKALRQAEEVVAVVHRNIEVINELWGGNARYIHIVRDPRDVARSNINMGWAGNVWYGVEAWLELERAWDALKKSLPHDAYIEVIQEELIRSPKRVLTQVCSFMGLDFSSSMLDYPQSSNYSMPDPDLTQQWQEKLTSSEIQLVEARVGNLLVERGYSMSGLEKQYPGAISRLRILFENKVRKLKFRLNFYGARLYFAELFSRRLRLTAWRKRLDSQLYVKWRSSLK